MIGIKAHIAILVAVLIAFVAALTWPPPPGPSISVVKTKVIDHRDLIK